MYEMEMNLSALRDWRTRHWSKYPMMGRFDEIQGLLAHAPRAGLALMDVHGRPARERIDAVIAACTQSLQDRPDLGRRLRQMVPVLVQEKISRAGHDPRQMDAFAAAVVSQSQSDKHPST